MNKEQTLMFSNIRCVLGHFVEQQTESTSIDNSECLVFSGVLGRYHSITREPVLEQFGNRDHERDDHNRDEPLSN